MALVRLIDVTGDNISIPDRMSSDDPDAPAVVIVCCETGEFLDPDADELRFIPAPEQPVIERLELETAPIAEDAETFEPESLSPEAQIARFEKRLAELRSGSSELRSGTVGTEGVADAATITDRWGEEVRIDPALHRARSRLLDRRAADLVARRYAINMEVARLSMRNHIMQGGADNLLTEGDFE